MRRLLIGMALLAAAGACGGDSGEAAACTHFRNTMNDYADGVLTGDELRDKLQEIDESAAGPVEAPARELLRANTQGDIDSFDDAIGEMDDACTEAGV